jgi:O-antigen ligase
MASTKQPPSPAMFPRVGLSATTAGAKTVGVSSLVLAIFAPLLLLTSTAAQRFLVALILLDIPLQIDQYFGHIEELAALGTISGFNVSLTTFALILLYLGWMVSAVAESGTPRLRKLRGSRPLAIYLGLAALSVIVARHPLLSLFELFMLAQMFMFYLYLVNWMRSREDVNFVVRFLLIGLILESAIIVAAYLGHGFSFPGVEARTSMGEFARSLGTFGSPNTAGSYLALFLPLAISTLLLKDASRRHALLSNVAVITGGVALLVTFSRGAWGAFLVALLVLFFPVWRRGWISRRWLLSVAIVVLVAAVFLQTNLSARLLGEDQGAAWSRVPLVKLAFRIIADNPLLGVGTNNFAAAMDAYLNNDIAREWLYIVHNRYLLVWAELGFAGLIAFVWFLVSTVRKGWRSWRVWDRLLSPAALGLTAGLIGFMVFMLGDTANNRALVQSLMCVAALIGSIADLGAGE